MVKKKRLSAIASIIMDYIYLYDAFEYYRETGVTGSDFLQIPEETFDGRIFAVDGSNVVLFDLVTTRVNHIRAGYVTYRGKEWQKTVITYDDIFVSDPKSYSPIFNRYLQGIFGLDGFVLTEAEIDRISTYELDRMSTYYRELQEYVALSEAISDAREGDLVLYDGGFWLWADPYQKVLDSLFLQAESKGVDLLGISKQSGLSWGKEVSRPFIPATMRIGSQQIPDSPWYIDLAGKAIEPRPRGSWSGRIYVAKLNQYADRAFRVDAPNWVVGRIGMALGHLARYSDSAESLGYPHALFRAHREIRIQEEERRLLRLWLMDELGRAGLDEPQVRGILVDYHESLEMRPFG
jgi:hypothetical protein